MSGDIPGRAFDIHQHVGRVPIAGGAEATVEEDVRLRLAYMDRFGIAQCALMPGHSYSAPRGMIDVRRLNDALVDYRRHAPERFPVVAGTLDPRHGDLSVSEVDRLHALGVQALSWHHRFQGLPMDHDVMFAIAERMDRCGMVFMAHCYANGDFEAIWRLRRLAEAFPALPFVALDAMTGPENLEQVVAAARVLPNVHLDLTTSVLGGEGIARCVDALGPGRLAFGTNYYSMSRAEDLPELADLADAGLGKEAEGLVLGGNARRIFGLARGDFDEGRSG